MIDLPYLSVKGSPREMGQQQGEALGEMIRNFVEVRFNALDGYLADRKTQKDGLEEVGATCMQIHKDWDPVGVEEHNGIAEASGIDPKVYSGFAFGMGIERIAMLKWQIGDLRAFFENDVRFLEQFTPAF